MDAGADLVAIQSVRTAGSGTDTAVGGIDGDHSEAFALGSKIDLGACRHRKAMPFVC